LDGDSFIPELVPNVKENSMPIVANMAIASVNRVVQKVPLFTEIEPTSEAGCSNPSMAGVESTLAVNQQWQFASRFRKRHDGIAHGL
jgi:hypothetical protein